MKAMVVNEFGGPEVFEFAEIEKPTPGDSQILIEVKASSVNPVDYKTRDGRTGFLAPIKPAVLHPDCAGVVTELGPGVEDFSIGDEVYCFASGLGVNPARSQSIWWLTRVWSLKNRRICLLKKRQHCHLWR